MMKRFFSWILLLVVVLWCLPAQAVTAKHYTQLKFPTLKQVQIPKYERFVLDNGMVVYLMPDRELPLVGGTALIHTGDRTEPPDKVGLANLVGSVMRSGGTQSHSADQLNQLLEQRRLRWKQELARLRVLPVFSSLSEDLEMVFGLFAEVLWQPIFAQDKLDLVKTQVRGGIARRNDNPNGIVGREFQKLIYGSNSPYARTVEYATLDNISRDDLISFYRQYFHPNNMILGIVGDFDPKQMRSLIQKYFGSLPSSRIPQLQLAPVSQANQSKMFLVNYLS
jgi:zinc protease